jgi:hypothetical protein
MQAKYKRLLRPGNEFDHLIAKPEGRREVEYKDGDVYDTVALMLVVAEEKKHQVAKLSEYFKQRFLNNTSFLYEDIWNFCYQHIQYKLDEDHEEQVREPARTWSDRRTGVDCDCFAVFISAILRNLGLTHYFRLAEYNFKGYYQHVYVVVKSDSGYEYIIDPVLDKFNYEAPPSNYIDLNEHNIINQMQIARLSGMDTTVQESRPESIYKSTPPENAANILNSMTYSSRVGETPDTSGGASKDDKTESSPSFINKMIDWVIDNPVITGISVFVILLGIYFAFIHKPDKKKPGSLSGPEKSKEEKAKERERKKKAALKKQMEPEVEKLKKKYSGEMEQLQTKLDKSSASLKQARKALNSGNSKNSKPVKV